MYLPDRCLEQVEVFRSKAWLLKSLPRIGAGQKCWRVCFGIALETSEDWVKCISMLLFCDVLCSRRLHFRRDSLLSPESLCIANATGETQESHLLGLRWSAISFPLQSREAGRFAQGHIGHLVQIHQLSSSLPGGTSSADGSLWPVGSWLTNSLSAIAVNFGRIHAWWSLRQWSINSWQRALILTCR